MQKQFSRMILMIAGVLTVVVILLSQSFYHPAENDLSKVKTEQKTDQHPHAAIMINAPADVVPSSAIQLDENIPTLLKTPAAQKENEETFFPGVEIVAPYFKILFRAIISPNAP
jgi:hypothetical protein